jgi:hypothetical protein
MHAAAVAISFAIPRGRFHGKASFARKIGDAIITTRCENASRKMGLCVVQIVKVWP